MRNITEHYQQQVDKKYHSTLSATELKVVPGFFRFHQCWSLHLFFCLSVFLLPDGKYSHGNLETRVSFTINKCCAPLHLQNIPILFKLYIFIRSFNSSFVLQSYNCHLLHSTADLTTITCCTLQLTLQLSPAALYS